MQKYNPNVPNPSCQGGRGETPVYDREESRIMGKYHDPFNFKAERLVMIHARLKNGEKLNEMGLDETQLAEWQECAKWLDI